jgi:peroxiredoxin
MIVVDRSANFHHDRGVIGGGTAAIRRGIAKTVDRAAPFRTMIRFVALAGCLTAASCGRKPAELTKSTAGDSATASLAEIQVPSGTPEELLVFAASLDEQALPEDAEQRGQELRRRMIARVTVSEAILAQEVTPENLIAAVQMKLDALRTLLFVDPHDHGQRFQPYVDALIKGPDPFLVRLAKTAEFQARVWPWIESGKDRTSDILAALDGLLRMEDACPTVLQGSREAVNWILPSPDERLTMEQIEQRTDTASQAYRKIGHRFYGNADANVAEEAKMLIIQADDLMLKNLDGRAIDGDEQAIRELVDFVKRMLDSEKPHGNELGFAIQTAQHLEWENRLNAALSIYELAWRRFKDDPDRPKAEAVSGTFEKAKVRLGLVGQPFSITGVLHDGTRFDWSDYRGKYVVVCFWGSWIEGWQTEVDNIRAAVKQFAERDIQVVTINLDDPQTRGEFLTKHPLEWRIVVSPDANRVGQNDPNAVRFGVEAVPFVVLVRPDGTVARIHAMGPALLKSLTELLAVATSKDSKA